ncbi:MAG: OmpH family outer membrane protein [Saprospiraceae bacterium]|nr:OmpH family outer membrane protein [Saprospiraceae bacterium]
MKNISLVLNIILLIAVAVLYGIVLSGKKSQTANSGTSQTASGEALKIAYVNADSLLTNYTAFKTQSEALAKKEKDADASLQAKGRAFEKEMQQAQQKVQQGLLAPNEIEKEQQRLGLKQQQLLAEREQVSRALLEEGQKLNEALQKDLLEKLKTLKEQEGYDFIFSYAAGGQILSVNDSLDITKKVLELLNAPKQEEKQ